MCIYAPAEIISPYTRRHEQHRKNTFTFLVKLPITTQLLYTKIDNEAGAFIELEQLIEFLIKRKRT